jgi:hypothetical protein
MKRFARTLRDSIGFSHEVRCFSSPFARIVGDRFLHALKFMPP